MRSAVFTRHNVKVSGNGAKTILFAHGYGCDQSMWRFVAPSFQDEYRVVLFDYVGAGASDASAYSRRKYGTLAGYASDVVDVIEAIGDGPVIFVGHSVSSNIGVMASIERPELFEALVLVGPSPRYINDEQYTGGFSRSDIEDLLRMLEDNHLGWSKTMAPVIMKNPEHPELAEELATSFCRSDPKIAHQFARVTFLSDNRADLPKVTAPTLVLQCTDDDIAPDCVGEYVHRSIPGSSFVRLKATGHCPHMSAPDETTQAIRDYVRRL